VGSLWIIYKRIGKWIIARSISTYLSQLDRMVEKDFFWMALKILACTRFSYSLIRASEIYE